MKREFSFEESFKVLEVLWSSLPPSYPTGPSGLPLFEKKFDSVSSQQNNTKALWLTFEFLAIFHFDTFFWISPRLDNNETSQVI